MNNLILKKNMFNIILTILRMSDRLQAHLSKLAI